MSKDEPVIPRVEKVHLDLLTDKKVELRGTAAEAHQGPVILVDNETPVYINGLESWEALKELNIEYGDEVTVSGTLIVDGGSSNLVAENGTVSHGIEGATYQIQGATFTKTISDGRHK